MKKLPVALCAVLVCALAVCLMTTQARAATEGDYTYTVADGEATIDQYTGSNADVVIPSSLGGYPVTAIGEYAFQNSELNSAIIPDSVVTIGNGAFYCCGLYEVTIGSGVRSIGRSAFSSCHYSEITIPDSVTDIGDRAFSECMELKTVNIGSGVKFLHYDMFDMCTAVTGYWVDEDNPHYSNDAFGMLFNKDKTELIKAPSAVSGSYTVPDSVVVVGTRAFWPCSDLEGIVMGDNVKEIGGYAFASCGKLAELKMGKGITTIGTHAFASCKKLTSIDIPVGVTTIGYSAFEYCRGLTGTVIIPDGVTLIDSFLFDSCSGLTAVVLGDNITQIRDGAFSECSEITTVYIPASLTDIGKSVFKECDQLTTVYYGGSQTQWDRIRYEYGNQKLFSATVYYNHVHTTEDPVEFVAAGCRSDGYGVYNCECGDIRREILPATGHNYQEGVCANCGIKEGGIPGDVDGNETVSTDDVIQLLLHVSMPTQFSIRADGDFTGDGYITTDDVIQLLLHVSMPETFPLQTGK